MENDPKRFLGETIQFVEETNTQGDSVLELQGMTATGLSDYSEPVAYGITEDILACLDEHTRAFTRLAVWHGVAAEILRTYGNARILQSLHNANLCVKHLGLAWRVMKTSDARPPSKWHNEEVNPQVEKAMKYYALLDTVDKCVLELIEPGSLARIGNYTVQLADAGYDVAPIPFNRSDK